MRRIILAATVALITITSARAEFALMGAGINTCAKFAQDYRLSPDFWETHYFAWAQGYMSGMNGWRIAADGTSQDLFSIPVQEQEQFLRTYCDVHPLASYSDGVLDLYRKFKPGRPVKSR